tara:strand:+ start:2406 stop:2909 length:504 start_codon:yes stop_codon:yes gene_type:complete
MALSKIQAESMNLADTYAFSGTVSGAGGGKLLQAVTTGYVTTNTATSTSTTQASMISLAITPSATSSKILILCQSTMEIVAGSSGLVTSNLYRGTVSGTKIGEYYGGIIPATSGNTSYIVVSHNILDAPSTTNSTTYTVGFAKGSGGTTSVRGHAIGRQLTLIEIGA